MDDLVKPWLLTGGVMNDPERCVAPPHPDLRDRLMAEVERLRDLADPGVADLLSLRHTTHGLGFDDGVIVPPDQFPAGTPLRVISRTAGERSPLRGALNVLVVLVDFSDKQMTATQSHFHDLFFSTGVLPHGSVTEYYQDVTNGLISVTGDVVGPYRMPNTLAYYANNSSGLGGSPSAANMAYDAAVAAAPNVSFSNYDNNGDGYVDAFIVVHAGQGAEVTGSKGDIWSHKSTLAGGAYPASGTKVFGYLTIPEDARIGVCCHELGHLLFGFPDLYDTTYASYGVGDWCLMSYGSWGKGTDPNAVQGDVPTHPSAWCKVNQGWVSVTNPTVTTSMAISDVKTGHSVVRLWQNGSGGSEYFLLENRQQSGYDVSVPGPGLLIWHCDDSQTSNTNPNHYWVGLMEADGNRDLALKQNSGDAGDPFPGSSNNTAFTDSSNPNSKSYAGADTCVSVSNISASAPSMTSQIEVSCKAIFKEHKELIEQKGIIKEQKDAVKEHKEFIKESKEVKEFKDIEKTHIDKLFEKPSADKGAGLDKGFDRPGGLGGLGGGQTAEAEIAELRTRVAALETMVGGQAPGQPFIGADLRPDLSAGLVPDDATIAAMQRGDAAAKRSYDKAPER